MNDIRDRILLIVPERLKKDFYVERKKSNTKRIYFIGIVVLIIQILFYLMNRLTPFSDDIVIMTPYFRFYLSFMSLNILTLGGIYFSKSNTIFIFFAY